MSTGHVHEKVSPGEWEEEAEGGAAVGGGPLSGEEAAKRAWLARLDDPTWGEGSKRARRLDAASAKLTDLIARLEEKTRDGDEPAQ